LHTPQISIIVPVKDEKPNIRPQIEEICAALRPLGVPFEIIYIDDGSSDGSWQELAGVQSDFPETRALRLDANHGQSAATDAGIRNALGEILVTLDGDRQNDPADIPRLLEKIGEADMVCGYRRTRRDSAWRRVQSRIANAIRNRLTRETIRDTGCSLKAFRRECFAHLTLYNGMHRFLPTLARMQGFRIVEVPVSHRPRTKGEPKYGMLNRVFASTRDLFAVRWMMKRQIRYRIAERLESANAGSKTG
jgi:dolichol-phosphate mannosyltransferase